MKIKDLVVGSTAELHLLVKNSEVKYTKPPGRKPYLELELFDGQQTIKAVDWDFGSTDNCYERNYVLLVKGIVSEWLGNKQLKLSAHTPDPSIPTSRFAPSGDVDIEAYWVKMLELIDLVENDDIKYVLHDCFTEGWSNKWREAPAAKANHHAFIGGNLKHSVDVAEKALALGKLMGANIDLCIAGGLLQDLGKLWTYAFDGAIIEMTYEGMMIEHLAKGIAILEQYKHSENADIILLLQHLISSHHGELQYGSPTTPVFLEAWIVHYSDVLDAKAQAITELEKKSDGKSDLLDKSYMLNNRQTFSRHFINRVLDIPTANNPHSLAF